jgi:GntR family transcriptional regulator
MTDDNLLSLKPHRLSLSQQAQHYLRHLIEAGTYEPGAQLPSQNELAAELGISRPTLREALLSLEQEGIIFLKHGVGTFVTPSYGRRLESGLERLESILELTTRQGLQVSLTGLQVVEEPAGPELAEVLQVTPETPLTAVRRVIMVDGAPVAYMSDVAPVSVLSPSDVDESFNGSVLDLLKQKQDVQIARAVANIVAINADSDLANQLQVKTRQALLLLEETLFNEEGVPMEFSRNYFVPACFQFHVVRR